MRGSIAEATRGSSTAGRYNQKESLDLVEEDVIEAQRDWLKTNNVGCVFANAIAKKKPRASWHDHVFLNSKDVESIDLFLVEASYQIEAAQWCARKSAPFQL